MFRELQQVLRLVTVLGKRRRRPGVRTAGGLLVLLWTETGYSDESLNCAVAAAGHWCTGIKMKELRHVLTDLKVSLFSCAAHCPKTDPEELSAFSELYGSLRLLLSFQIKDAKLLSPEWQANLEAFLHTFSLGNAEIKIHLKFKNNQQTFQQEFGGKIKTKVPHTDQPSLILDVTCNIQPPECVKKGCWCQGGHPILGSRLPLSIPSHVMAEGLYGDLSIQFVTLLSPCVLQYPNLATQLTHIQISFVLVYSPSNVPVTKPFNFFQTFSAHLDCHELGLHGLHCSSLEDFLYSGGIVYTVMQENWYLEQKSWFPPMEQSLLLFLFLQHNDPFISQLSDIMATEALIEQHLEVILSNNKQAVTSAMQTELKNTLKAQNGRKRASLRYTHAK
ncbi:hypothetical protein Q8A73_010882 [Channa argus]|nr:hypothetical protein Q8A73_010882 [Channa argus]